MKICKGQYSASVFLSGSNVTSGINFPGEIVPITIGNVLIKGSSTPVEGVAQGYQAQIGGNASDAAYAWTTTDASAVISSPAGSSTNITFSEPGPFTVSCEVTSDTATDTPATGNLAVSVTEAPTSAPGQDPIVAWATIDAYPYDGSYNSSSGTVPIAIVAIDEWVGVSSVEFTFDASVTVGGSTSTTHTVNSSSWVDVHGTGRSGEYWVCPVTKASIDSNGYTVNVTGITITKADGTTFDAHAKIGSRVINTKLASETVKTVGSSGDYASIHDALSDSNSGTRGNASCFDRIQIAAGTWTLDQKLIPGSVSRTAPIILEPLDPNNPPIIRIEFSSIPSDPNDNRFVVVDDWIVIEDCTIKQDHETIHPVDLIIVGHHIGFKNCTFNRGVAGVDYGSVLANNDNSLRHVWFCGCDFIAGHRGIVTGRRASSSGEAFGYSHDLIVSNCTFTGMGSCLRLEWDRCLVEYVVASDNQKQDYIEGDKPDSRGWATGQHFNFINTGNGTIGGGDSTLDSVILRGIVSSDSGRSENNYAGMQLYGKANNYAFVDFVSYVYQENQQVFYTTTNLSFGGTQLNNIQMCGLVIGAQDLDVDRGIAFNYASDPETTFSNMLLQNSLANRINTSALPNTEGFTIRNYKTAVATGAGQDDDFQTDDAYSDFTDSNENIGMSLLVTSQDPTPKSGSLLEGNGGTRRRKYDLYGNEWASSSTIGAVETQ